MPSLFHRRRLLGRGDLRIAPACIWTFGLAAIPLVLALLLSALPVGAQEFRRPATAQFSAQDPGRPAGAQELRRPAAPHYDVVALRVEFQPDTSRFTTGDGTFGGDLFGGLQPSVDPLPHDAGYFEAHLSFLSDYVERVSAGRTRVTTHLVPEVVRVSKPMGEYSPTGRESGSDPEMAKLAALVAEAWQLAGEQSAFDMSRFDPDRTALVLFHAGVGRDIELIGTTLDKTPQDLPSIYFHERSLSRLLGRSDVRFRGFPVDHTILLPRTETRPGFDFIQDQTFLLELSINGLMAASFFNFLEVPDLFDTETGQSAIGPFGLMDPLGIFAYRGLFPPEPMAWTKYFLGWADPVEVTDETITLRAASRPGGSDVARVPISSSEYFLVENRYRDPEEDGLVLRVWKDGEIVEQRVQNGDETFNNFTIDGFVGGVVVGVDNYDWALPGGLDEQGNVLNGGILIWHVDERRLAEGMAANRVNADPRRRAIDLEEADSAQDIGFPSGSSFGPQNELGSPFDFYYEGNPATVITQTGGTVRLYRNRFGPDTHPSSDTNEGGPSFVVLEGFSAPGAEMTFEYQREAHAGIRPADGISGLALGRTFRPGGRIVAAGDDILLSTGPAEDNSAVGIVVDLHSGSVETSDEARWVDAAVAAGGDAYFVRAGTTSATLVPLAAGGTSQTAIVLGEGALEPPPVVLQEGGRPVVVIRRESVAEVVVFEPEATTRVIHEPALSLASDGRDLFVVGTTRTVAGSSEWSYALTPDAGVGQAVFGRDRGGLMGAIPLTGSSELMMLQPGGDVIRVDAADVVAVVEGDRRTAPNPEAVLSAYPVPVDLDDDGLLDVLVTYGRWLLAFTQAGAVVDGYPVRLPVHTVAQPLVARLTDSGSWSTIISGTDGYLYAYERGEPVPGFPLAVGARIDATPLLANRLYAVANDGTLQAWTVEALGDVWWGTLYGSGRNLSYVELTGDSEPGAPEAAARLLAPDETYNWPNPVRDGFTHLRFRTNREARIRITIVDGAGGLIDEIDIPHVPAGVPAEHLWVTDAGSGLYFARVTATADDGESESRLVKMAIIR